MDAVLKWLKKHHKLVITLVIVLILFLIVYFSFQKILNYLSPSSKKSVYGDRCDDVIGTPLTEDEINDVKNLITERENISVVDVKNSCKLIDIIINIDVDTDFENINNLGKDILNILPSAIVEKYDIQLFVTSSNKEDTNYPKIGTHHKYVCTEQDPKKIEEECKQVNEFVW